MTSILRTLPFVVGPLALLACSSSTTPDGGGADAGPDTSTIITFDAGPDTGPPDLGTDGGSVIGHPCTSDADCPGGMCDTMITGYCVADCSGGGTCPTGAVCVMIGGGMAYCLPGCDSTSPTRTCPHGYGCGMTMEGDVCLPGCSDDTDCAAGTMCDPMAGGNGAGACFTPGAMVGAPCTVDTMCPSGGICLDEMQYGEPGGTCVTQGCDATTNMGCTGDAVCRPQRFGGGLCFDGCVTDSDCGRPAYRCLPDATYPTRHYCAPGCTSSSQCTVTGDVCNPATGLCAPPLTTSEIGGNCGTRMATVACDGGSCFSENTTGFPNSYCSFLGCTTGGTECGSGNVCATALRTGTRFCLDGCAHDTDCRTGYGCLPSDRADPTSPLACQPHCTSNMQCQARMTGMNQCNTGTGLCTQPFTAANEGRPCAGPTDCVGGFCYTETTAGYPMGECVAVGCRNGGTGTGGITCPTGSTCVDDAIGDPDIGQCEIACMVGAAGGCRAGYACVMTGTTGTAGTCKPMCTATDCTAPLTCNTTTGLCAP